MNVRPLASNRMDISKDRIILEVMLLVVTIGMAFLLYRMGGYKMVVLNLFFLPIVLSGYYLGRTSAGVLALFSVLAVTIATVLNASGFSAYSSPVLVGLALAVWGACLGLTALLVGTLCDERARTVDELHVAYVGVVEVLSKYLQNANPSVKARSTRIAELCHAVAVEMRLSRKQIDDVRVAALLYDLGKVEITTQWLTKAVDALGARPGRATSYTFSGMDLVHSLASVLSGALPLLLNQAEAALEYPGSDLEVDAAPPSVPIGARIIRTVRAFDGLSSDDSDGPAVQQPAEAIRELRKDITGGYDADVLDALERCVRRGQKGEVREWAMT